jgi:hypothetical protein
MCPLLISLDASIADFSLLYYSCACRGVEKDGQLSMGRNEEKESQPMCSQTAVKLEATPGPHPHERGRRQLETKAVLAVSIPHHGPLCSLMLVLLTSGAYASMYSIKWT